MSVPVRAGGHPAHRPESTQRTPCGDHRVRPGAREDNAGDERVRRRFHTARRRGISGSLVALGAVPLAGLRADGLGSVCEQCRGLDADGGRSGADADPDDVVDAGRADSAAQHESAGSGFEIRSRWPRRLSLACASPASGAAAGVSPAEPARGAEQAWIRRPAGSTTRSVGRSRRVWSGAGKWCGVGSDSDRLPGAEYALELVLAARLERDPGPGQVMVPDPDGRRSLPGRTRG